MRRVVVLTLVLLLTVAACKSTTNVADVGPTASPSVSAAATTPGGGVCGTPPCDEYLSRSDTSALDTTVNGHGLAGDLVLHLVLAALCGGLLCELGGGLGLAYVQDEVHVAAQDHACLRVHVLPQDRAWELVNVDTSNGSYCKD